MMNRLCLIKYPNTLSLKNICFLESKNTSLLTYSRAWKSTKSTRKSTEAEAIEEPIPFFGSHASVWRAKATRSGGADEYLWYQPYVISGSLAIFLLYFCVFREESDIDQKLDGDLFQHVKGLEEVQLTMNYKYNKEHGLDTKDIEKRLKELGVNITELNAKSAVSN
ncbi:uncharacterized protein LOC119638679 [Glossina fuscipes]|uniref:Uncharacterized protein LOC119638679 n=1 Tax=Glossina fuscipes TaxID=7396 RepID=A0A9C5Z7Z7_9MUSC|nr:uncharacterized protein LOC119638679 [Glossina fuscipes]